MDQSQDPTNTYSSSVCPRIFCIGSINVDYIYKCEKVSGPDHALLANSYARLIGGKGWKALLFTPLCNHVGLNQAYSIFKAGITDIQYHGIVGDDGAWIVDELKTLGFPTKNIKIQASKSSGHVIIQKLEDEGVEDAVLLHRGTNYSFTQELLEGILKDAHPGDYLLLQGETNMLEYAMNYAKNIMGMIVIFNAAPWPPQVSTCWRAQFPIDWLIINADEAMSILEKSDNPNCREKYNIGTESALRSLMEHTSSSHVIVTLGGEGCRALLNQGETLRYYACPAIKVKEIDTTGAGDSFTGYFIASLLLGRNHYGSMVSEATSKLDDVEFALALATAAAAICVTRLGAFVSIPESQEVTEFLIQSLPELFP